MTGLRILCALLLTSHLADGKRIKGNRAGEWFHTFSMSAGEPLVCDYLSGCCRNTQAKVVREVDFRKCRDQFNQCFCVWISAQKPLGLWSLMLSSDWAPFAWSAFSSGKLHLDSIWLHGNIWVQIRVWRKHREGWNKLFVDNIPDIQDQLWLLWLSCQPCPVM